MIEGKPRPEYDARIWVDSAGQVLKSEQDVLGGIVMYRTTKEAATSPGGPVQFDLILGTVVKVARKIPDPERTRHVKYRITLKESDPAQLIPNDPRQTLQTEASTNSAILEVRSVGPLDGAPSANEAEPQYLKPNALVTSDDIRVRSLAERATRGNVVRSLAKATTHRALGAPEHQGRKNFQVCSRAPTSWLATLWHGSFTGAFKKC